MNEMNNGENNNQNIEQPNINQNSMVQPEQPVQEQPVSEPPKKNNSLVVVLILIIVGLAGFIVYDKVLKKEEVKEPEKQEENSSNLSEEEENKKLEKFDKSKSFSSEVDVNKKEATLSYKDADLKVDFKVYADNIMESNDLISGTLYLKLYINGNEVDKIKVEEFDACKDENNCDGPYYESIEYLLSSSLTSYQDSIGTINGDKYYLYIEMLSDSNPYILVLNESGKQILKQKIGANQEEQLDNKYYDLLSKDCNKHDKYNKKLAYYIDEDAIYYLDLTGYQLSNQTKLIESKGILLNAFEKKVTFKNDEYVKTEINQCDACVWSQKNGSPCND